MPPDSQQPSAGMRKAIERFPDRPDLQSGLARLEWQGGDLDATQRALAAADRAGRQPSSRWLFANQLLTSGGVHRHKPLRTSCERAPRPTSQSPEYGHGILYTGESLLWTAAIAARESTQRGRLDGSD